jgi:hypothetical protein
MSVDMPGNAKDVLLPDHAPALRVLDGSSREPTSPLRLRALSAAAGKGEPCAKSHGRFLMKLAPLTGLACGSRLPSRATPTGGHVMRAVDLTREGTEHALPAVDLRSPVARGRKGGMARAKSLSPERKREIAKVAAQARWKSGNNQATS